MPLPNPVIVVPGITATYLRDRYPIPPELVWSVLTKHYERASLHPDEISTKLAENAQVLEATQPTNIVADQVYEIAYEELIEELRYNLRAKEDEPVPVYPFGYDWRQPLELVEDRLAEFIEEVIGRTKLMRHYDDEDYADHEQVNLVGHSMGGLIIAGYLARHGAAGRVGKVVSLASPFKGSLEVVVKVTTGNANLGTSAPSSREREAARLTPALYYLAPSFTAGLEFDEALPNSLFDPAVWQESIFKTIAEYIRLRGLNPDRAERDRIARAREIMTAMLAAASDHRARIEQLDLGAAGLAPQDWLCIVGVDASTRVALQIANARRGPAFVFRPDDLKNQWLEGVALEERRQTGDGTVPFEGALPGFLPYETIVCVRPEDFGFWEIGDKAALQVGGFHGILPNMNLIHRLIVRHFTGRPDRHRSTWGWPAPGAEANWDPPLSLEVGQGG